VWKTLRHPNVLPLLGVTVTENRLVMVSEWMDNGNINEFTAVDTNADRLELVRFFLPFEVLTSLMTDALHDRCS
jgi:serine/threonine protein kinase